MPSIETDAPRLDDLRLDDLRLDDPRLDDRLTRLNDQARAFIAPGRPDVILRQWLGRPRAIGQDPAWEHAWHLAMELVLMTPSLTGITAFDRLARSLAGRSAEERAAADLLCRSRLGLLRVSGHECADVATGQPVSLPAGRPTGSGMRLGRVAELPGGRMIAVGPMVPLDEAARAIVAGFVRNDGRGLDNPLRCAEAVYRHLARTGAMVPRDDSPFDPASNPVDHLAAAWAELGRDPHPSEQARARALARPATLLDTLVSVSIAADRGLARLATAYRWIAAIMVETIALRGAAGSAGMNLDAVARDLNAGIARGTFSPAAATLFETLRAGVGRTRAPAGAGAATDLDKLVQRIQALRAKTVEQGCTEQEALAAAEKVAELLDRYGLSLSELDLRQQACEGVGVETGRKRRGPIDDCMTTIAQFFDCRVWVEIAEDGTLRYIFFGMPADVQASVYLHDLIALAFASETAAFQAGPIYLNTPSTGRRTATTSFQAGLARGIVHKLTVLRQSRDAAASDSGTGRALVPVKDSIIDSEMDRLGLNLRRRSAVRRHVLRDAYGEGRRAGEKFEYRPGIGAEK
jgi:hypothetical protein